jgi:hypothetical protein
MGHEDDAGGMLVDAARIEAMATAEAARASDPAAMDEGGEGEGEAGGVLQRPKYGAVNPNDMVRCGDVLVWC